MPAALTSLSEQSRAYLQERVALFARVAFAIGSVGVVGEALFNPSELNRPWFAAVVFSVTPMGALWLLCRSGARSVRLVRAAETLALALSVLGCVLMGRYFNADLLPLLPAELGFEGMPAALFGVSVVSFARVYIGTVVAFVLTYTFVVRAAVVPSSPRRTLALMLGFGVVVVVVPSLEWFPFEGEALRELYRDTGSLMSLAYTGSWWVFTTGVCVAISVIVHGLRREVREARQLGQYTLEKKIGEGGMGTVYRARHALMRRPTAIKLLPPESTGEAHVARFEREVQATAGLTHPNTITVFDYGRTPDGIFYYAMELLDGANLTRVIEVGGAMPAARVINVLRGVAGALEEAHGVGLIHRDIKPGNIILCTRGGKRDIPMLLDFGLVKKLSTSTDPRLTSEDAVTGTPMYLSPESLVDPNAVDARSDLYSLGAVGYFLLTGQPPFNGRTVIEVCGHHLHTLPLSPGDRLGRPVPDDLSDLLLRCLAKRPEERPMSAAAFLETLAGCVDAYGWTDREASGWWREHAAAVEASSAADTGLSRELTIAVERRNSGHSNQYP